MTFELVDGLARLDFAAVTPPPLVLDPYALAMLGEAPIEHTAAAICRPLTLCAR